MALQQSYQRHYPQAAFVPGTSYLSAGFEGGRNIFCAIDPDGRLQGYAPLFPVLTEEPHMANEFTGIVRRLDELKDRLARLEPLRDRARVECDADPYMRDIVERNLEVSAQCCIDICHRIIVLENARKPVDYFETFLIMGEPGILPADFARRIAQLAGFRNILIHEYLKIDWDLVYKNLQNLDDLTIFSETIRGWLSEKGIH